MMVYEISFRCYYHGADNNTTHYRTLPLEDIPKWIAAYQFTHPDIRSITCKIWFGKESGK